MLGTLVNTGWGKIVRSRRILFITWDGPQTQYLGRLFLPVFEQLASAGYRITILQFSSAGPELRHRIQSQCVESGVQYVSVPVIKRLGIFGVILSLVRGSAWLTLRLTQRDFDIVIVRSIVPALVFLVTQGKRRVPLVYDSDGLPIEQRLEFEGLKEKGLLHRVLLLIERLTLRRAIAVVSRSRFGSSILQSRVREDLSRKLFLQHNNGVGLISRGGGASGEETGPKNKKNDFTLAFVGSWGEQYAPRQMLSLAIAVKEKVPQTKFRVFSGDSEAAHKDLEAYGLSDAEWVTVEEVSFNEVHEALKKCDIGLAFRLSSSTAESVYPLKVADYLFAGLPIVGNMVADMENELVTSGVFLDVQDHHVDEIERWCADIRVRESEDIKGICVSLAQRLYRLEVTADVYIEALAHAESHS